MAATLQLDNGALTFMLVEAPNLEVELWQRENLYWVASRTAAAARIAPLCTDMPALIQA